MDSYEEIRSYYINAAAEAGLDVSDIEAQMPELLKRIMSNGTENV